MIVSSGWQAFFPERLQTAFFRELTLLLAIRQNLSYSWTVETKQCCFVWNHTNATWENSSTPPGFSCPWLAFNCCYGEGNEDEEENTVFRDGHPELTLGSYRPTRSLPVRWLSRFLESQMTRRQWRLRTLLVTLSENPHLPAWVDCTPSGWGSEAFGAVAGGCRAF